MGILHDDLCIFVISRWILLRMRNVSDKVVEKMKIRISFRITCSENRAVCEVMC